MSSRPYLRICLTGAAVLLAVAALVCPSAGDKLDKVSILCGKLSDKRACVGCRAAVLLGRSRARRAVKPLIAALGSKEVDLRCAAAEALGEIGDTRAVKPLIAALKDRDVCIPAAEALGKMRARAAVGPLTSMLARGTDRAEAVLGALAEIGDPSAAGPILDYAEKRKDCTDKAFTNAFASMNPPPVDLLIGELQSASPERRGVAAMALAAIDDGRATEPVIELLRHEDAETRRLAVDCLAKMSNRRAVDMLALAAQDADQDSDVRAAAAQALGAAMPENASTVLLPLLDDPDEVVCAGAVDGLARCGDAQALRLLISLSQSNSLPEEASLALCGSVHNLRGQALRPWLELVHDADSAVRRRVVSALSSMGNDDAQIVPALLGAAKDSDPNIRRDIVRALTGSSDLARDPHILNALIAFTSDTDTEVRRDAVEALWRFNDPAARSAAIAATRDPDEGVRERALSSLGEIVDAQVAIPLLGDPAPGIREQAAQLLGQAGDARAVEPLAKALNDTNARVRLAAACSLAQLGDCRALGAVVAALGCADNESVLAAGLCLHEIKAKSAIGPLRNYLGDRRAHDLVILAMARCGDHASVMKIIGKLPTHPPAGRQSPAMHIGEPGGPMPAPGPATQVNMGNIVLALGASGDRSATEPLLRCADLEEEFTSCSTLASALAQLKDPAAASAVAKLLDVDRDSVRWNAAWVLAQIDSKEASAALMAGLKEWDTTVIGGGAHFFIRNGVEEAIPILVDSMLMMDDCDYDLDVVEGSLASGRSELVAAARKCTQQDWCYQLDGVPDWGGRYCAWAEGRPAQPGELSQP